ncbi:MAG: c-type cytochrome [Chloroflexi bacterium]|nr:c-type cytochrome [Chloroflexota bacterium]
MRQPAPHDNSKGSAGWALILLAVIAGLGLVAILYKWESSERAVVTASPTRIAAISPSPTPAALATPAETPTVAPLPGVVSFSRDIQPIFKARCLGCHGTLGLGGLDLSSYDAIFSTGNRAPVVIPESAQGSVLYRSLRGGADGISSMPPGPPLSEEQIEAIGRWIDQGALEN